MREARGPILIVEDNADDLFLLQKALELNGVTKELAVARDGDAAVAALSRRPPSRRRSSFWT